MKAAVCLSMCLLMATWSAGETFSGTVRSETDVPIPNAFVGALGTDHSLVGYGISGQDGQFSFQIEAEVEAVAVQPPGEPHPSGVEVYQYQPRIYTNIEDGPLDIRLPEVGVLILEARDEEGELLRWRDFEARGQFGGVFAYATDLNDEMIPSVVWPVHDAVSKEAGAPRDKGLPGLTVPIDETTIAQLLFWETAGYGKLLLRADNGGDGFRVRRAGDAIVVDINVELARTAVADLERRRPAFHPLAGLDIAAARSQLDKVLDMEDPVKRAAAADILLADALALRDRLELERAREQADTIRQGQGEIRVRDAQGAPVPDATITIEQQTQDFLFGVFEGSPFNAEAFQTARDAGFNLATVLPAWGWTDLDVLDGVDNVIGVSALNEMGYTVKAHGVVWMQDYGILPDGAYAMSPRALQEGALGFARGLVEAWRDSIAIWEVINEPATTNVVGLPRDAMVRLMADAAAAVKDAGRRTLINSPHESTYGRQFQYVGPDHKPVDGYSTTYATFLRMASEHGALDDVDVLGLQFYPGARLDDAVFGGHQAPAQTFGWLVDTLERYAAFNKPIHITEFSLPSTYDDDWHAGYWREPWNPQVQADYAEAVFALAFGTETVESVTWWDITDEKPSVVTGGLISETGPKPVFHRLSESIDRWTTSLALETDARGEAYFSGYGGHYRAEAELPNGDRLTASFHLPAGTPITLTMEPE